MQKMSQKYGIYVYHIGLQYGICYFDKKSVSVIFLIVIQVNWESLVCLFVCFITKSFVTYTFVLPTSTLSTFVKLHVFNHTRDSQRRQ